VRIEHIQQMVGWYGHLQAAFEVACLLGVLKDGFKLQIAMRMERIEEGIMKWKNAQSAQRQELDNAPSGEAPGGASGQ